jgi:hypothetical protein
MKHKEEHSHRRCVSVVFATTKGVLSHTRTERQSTTMKGQLLEPTWPAIVNDRQRVGYHSKVCKRLYGVLKVDWHSLATPHVRNSISPDPKLRLHK